MANTNFFASGHTLFGAMSHHNNQQLAFSPPPTLDNAFHVGLDFESIRPGNKDFESVALVFLRSRLCVGRAQDRLEHKLPPLSVECPQKYSKASLLSARLTYWRLVSFTFY